MKFKHIRPVLFYSLAFLCFAHAKASRVLASSFGFDATNATSAFQEAIQSDFDTIVVDKQSADWNVAFNHFFDLTERVIIFEPGVVLNAIPGAFPETGHCLFRLVRCHNITIIGYQAIFKMNKPEYVALDDSEYRHCLHIDNCLNIKVFGLTLRDSGGDGVYVGGANWWGETRTYSENIWLEDLRCINNYRQGLSICSVENMTVTHCQFSETKGTLPESGIDIEPFETYQRIVNLTIDHCVFTKNDWAGLAVALVYLDSTSLPVSIKIQDCLFSQNSRSGHPYGPCELHVGADKTKPVQGSVLFERCVVDSSQWTVMYSRKTNAAFGLKFKDCVFKDVSLSQNTPYNEPIFMEVPDYDNPSATLGGIDFDHVLLTYPSNFPFFRIYGWSSLAGVENITGNITVLAPQGVAPLYENISTPINVAMTYDLVNTLPQSNLFWSINAPNAYECTQQAADFKVQRTSTQTNYPLSVHYQTNGTALLGDDVHLPTNTLVIPANQFSASENIIARQDGILEPLESYQVFPQNSALYSNNSTNLLDLSVFDCLGSGLVEQGMVALFSVSPNPVVDIFEIKSDLPWKKVNLYNELGVKMETFLDNEMKSIQHLPDGVYFLEIELSSNNDLPLLPIKIFKLKVKE
jgi:hypothetical protein